MPLREHNPRGIEGRIELLRGNVQKGIRDPEVSRLLGLSVTRACPWRDDRCELEAIWYFMHKNIRYTGDIQGYDTFQSARRTLQYRGGDCLPEGTLLLVEGHQLVPIEKVVAGQRIWGLDKWSTVSDVWYKDALPVDAVQLNNGSWFKATPDHKVYVGQCLKHDHDEEHPCSCPMAAREVVRMRVADLRPKMVMITPERIPFGTDEMDEGRALVEGLFLSDGFISHDASFDISGQDGCPKEEQKREVEAICARLGIPTTWQRKYINIRDRAWTQRMRLMGAHAPEKHALSINWNESTARALLRGIMADSGANTHGGGRTFTSTSRQLELQTRLFHKMFGVACGETYIEDHGGLGRNPIWRLFVRAPRVDGKDTLGRNEKLLRVRAIERAVAELPVYDISTDDHYVYLPEADVTVSNCDDGSVLIAALALGNGFSVKFRITKNQRSGSWAHIYSAVGFPKHNPRTWIPLDWTLGYARFGAHPPQAGFVEFDGHQISYDREISPQSYEGW